MLPSKVNKKTKNMTKMSVKLNNCVMINNFSTWNHFILCWEPNLYLEMPLKRKELVILEVKIVAL